MTLSDPDVVLMTIPDSIANAKESKKSIIQICIFI